MADCESAVEAPPSLPLSSSPSGSKQQQQQQLQLGPEDDNRGVSDCVKPADGTPITEPGADVPVVDLPVPVAAAGEDDSDVSGDERDVDGRKRVKICLRCDKEFSSETDYVKHCRKCCDD